MDISVLAAVGSFWLSERLLKPKATLLAILGCVLAYDLTTKTQDVASLRAYRGPALCAFTLMMTAFSLRTWRRNGVACDELLFLPGTEYGEYYENSNPQSQLQMGPVVAPVGQRTTTGGTNPTEDAEGDVAAGVARPASNMDRVEAPLQISHENTDVVRRASFDGNSEISSIQEQSGDWGEDGDEDDDQAEARVLIGGNAEENQNTTRVRAGAAAVSNAAARTSQAVNRFQENHPRITRIGSFFFFRSSSSSTDNATYAPSGPSVVGAALDMSMPILFNFHLFIEAFNHIGEYGSDTPAKILPLIFLSVLMVRTVIPPGRRGRFWGTVKFTFMAPFHRTRFRDCFLGDILTSLVRPCQDIVFALAYYVTVIWGTISLEYGLSDSGRILETSWILHNVILPSCALLPLWWKFLQTLREAYDTGHRWPHLGNAFKHLTAALVVLYGMTHPEDMRSPWWIVSFVLCLIYQIWWDTIMDWELFEIVPNTELCPHSVSEPPSWFNATSSVSADSHVRLALERHLFQPFRDCVRFVWTRTPGWRQIRLRQCRLYKGDAFYWRIFCFNALCRVTWMLCFIPAYRLSPSGDKKVETFRSDTNSYVGVLLPVLEILRRTVWGFLLLEMKTIKMTASNPAYARLDNSSHSFDEELADLDHGNHHSEQSQSGDSSKDAPRYRTDSWLTSSVSSHQQQLQEGAVSLAAKCGLDQCLRLSKETKHNLFVAELSLWAVAFCTLGLWATT